jgi:hypothetical protein
MQQVRPPALRLGGAQREVGFHVQSGRWPARQGVCLGSIHAAAPEILDDWTDVSVTSGHSQGMTAVGSVPAREYPVGADGTSNYQQLALSK